MFFSDNTKNEKRDMAKYLFFCFTDTKMILKICEVMIFVKNINCENAINKGFFKMNKAQKNIYM